jgi:hypothetical protein
VDSAADDPSMIRESAAVQNPAIGVATTASQLYFLARCGENSKGSGLPPRRAGPDPVCGTVARLLGTTPHILPDTALLL